MDPNAKMRQAAGVGSQAQQQMGPKKYDGQNGNPLYDMNNGGHYGE
jgi:hypothetical protein